MSTFKSISKRLLSKTVLGAVVFVLPAYAIKWGQLHSHTDWPKYLASAWSVGIFNSPLGHRDFYGAHFHWQELACLLIYMAVWIQAEYLFAVFGPEDAKRQLFPRTKKQFKEYFLDREQSLITATTIFVFLFVAVCALCERIQMGTIFGINDYLPQLRDLGILIETYLLFKTINILSQSIQFNGMIVRTDLERCYLLVIWSLGGLSLAFADWFPLLALPGARIATQWIFTALRENSESGSVDADDDEPVAPVTPAAPVEPVIPADTSVAAVIEPSSDPSTKIG